MVGRNSIHLLAYDTLNLSAWLIRHGTLFFSYTKSTNNIIHRDFSAKRTGLCVELGRHLQAPQGPEEAGRRAGREDTVRAW